MNPLNLGKNEGVTRIDGRCARSWWHGKAREMIVEGATLIDVAKRYRVTESAVRYATRAEGASTRKREFTKLVEGNQRGNFKRVAISFTADQVEKINALAEARGKSFSAIVAGLVDAALADQPSEYERLVK